LQKENDPIAKLKSLILETKEVSEDDLKKIDKEIKARIKEAAEFAQESPELPPEDLWTDVLVEVE
ncbi:MAG: thiamine pyrophosphate-dependent enzyme, partial [Pseudomonadota bacterium]